MYQHILAREWFELGACLKEGEKIVAVHYKKKKKKKKKRRSLVTAGDVPILHQKRSDQLLTISSICVRTNIYLQEHGLNRVHV
jgi:hypothetical protein